MGAAMDSGADWTTAGGTVALAIAAIATAIIAWRAATTWKDALQNQRDDECVAAASELRSSIHRCMSAVRRKRAREIWPAWTEAWNSQTRFRSRYLVARRYHAKEMAADVPDQIETQLNLLYPICLAVDGGEEPDEAGLRGIPDQVKQIVDALQLQLQPPTSIPCPVTRSP
jgi:hypothetical protein